MGNNICKPDVVIRNTLIIDPNDNQKFGFIIEEPFNAAISDTLEGDDGSDPLNNFMIKQSKKTPLCASNKLSFLQPSKQEKKPKQSPIVIKGPKGKGEGKISSRCSIDKAAILQFQSTIKQFVVNENNVDSYGRIQINQQKFIQLRKEDIRKYYKLQQQVGQGAYGSVYKATCLTSKEVRAIKVIKKQNMANSKLDQVFSQLQLLKKFDHPNIIKLYQVFQSDSRYHIVTQFCNGGSIIEFIKSRKHFDEHIIKIILKQLLCCLNYLHTMHIVHRDIKLENVMFIRKIKERSSSDEVDLKLLDFGTACKMTKPKVRCNDLIGTISYMPPQIIKGYFTEKCDIWSCGVMFYILLTSKSPFKCKKKDDTLQKILTHEIRFQQEMWFEVSKNAKDLLAKMLEKDPYKRISADSALQHPWFTSHHEQGPRKTSGFLKDLSLYFRQNNLVSVIESYLIFSRMSQDERKRISAIFQDIDKNNDGFIGKEELIQAYKEYNPKDFNKEQVRHILNKLDKDNSGSINFNEFASAVASKEKLWAKESLSDAFDYFDTDKTGYIQKDQLAHLLEGSDSAEIEQLLNELDVDKDKRISKQEFINYFLKKGCLH